MKKNLLLSALTAFVACASFAQTPAPTGTVPAPANPAAAPAIVKSVPPVATPTAPVAAKSAIHAVCKDGSAFDGDSMKGACSGHGGVDKKATKAANSSAPAAGPKTATAPTATGSPTTKPAATVPMAQAPGGGAGKVWGNTSTKVYHCASDRYYGKTKKGEYMSEADAKSKGFHADHGKACAA